MWQIFKNGKIKFNIAFKTELSYQTRSPESQQIITKVASEQ